MEDLPGEWIGGGSVSQPLSSRSCRELVGAVQPLQFAAAHVALRDHRPHVRGDREHGALSRRVLLRSGLVQLLQARIKKMRIVVGLERVLARQLAMVALLVRVAHQLREWQVVQRACQGQWPTKAVATVGLDVLQLPVFTGAQQLVGQLPSSYLLAVPRQLVGRCVTHRLPDWQRVVLQPDKGGTSTYSRPPSGRLPLARLGCPQGLSN